MSRPRSPASASAAERMRASLQRAESAGGKRLPPVMLNAAEHDALRILIADGNSMRDAVGAALLAAAEARGK